MGSFKDIISTVRDMTVFIGIVLFVTGYIYRNAYFEALGITSHGATTDVNETLIYATTVIVLRWWWFLVLAVVIAASAHAINRQRKFAYITARTRAHLIVALSVVSILGSILVGEAAAYTSGRSVAHDVLTEHDVHFSTLVLDDKVPLEYQALLKRKFGDKISHLVIVTENADSYFVIRTNPRLGPNEWASAFRLPKALVRAVRTFQ